VFERLISVMPGSSAPLENLGVLALERGDVNAATRYFAQAIVVTPGSSRAHGGAGAAAFQRGDRAAAYAAWSRAVQLDPDNFDAFYSLGINLARDGRLDAARPYLEQFVRTAPAEPFATQLREASRLLQSRR
jgi:superkiller protein 3